MSENYNDKDIEKLIFGGGLASGEIEPSEKFWNKAYEDILQRENKANSNRISKWKGAFFGMGAIALLLGTYAIYMHTEVNGIKQQLTKIERTQINTLQQNITEKSSIAANINSTKPGNNPPANQANAISSANTKHVNTVIAKENTTGSSLLKNNSSGHNKATNTPPIADLAANRNNNPLAVKNETPDLKDRGAEIKNTETASVANTNSNTTQATSGNTSSSITENTGVTDAPSKITDASDTNQHTTSPVQNSSTLITKTAASNKKADSSGAKVSILDSSNLVITPKKPITLAGIASKTSVSAFYAPGVTEDFLRDKDNDPTHTITAHVLKTQQDGDGTYALGFHLAYDISNKLTIQTGAYYSQYTYNINPTIIHAQQQENGQVGYSVTTSSGTVFLPNSEVPASLGDSIKVKGSSSRGYISIPLQLKYKFASSRKFDFYVDGGFCMNIAIDRETSIHWENTALQEGDLSVPSIYGLNSVQYSYNFGFGAEYLIGKGLSIYTEPFMNGSFTSINKNTPVITYPYFFGLAFGLTYHF